MNLTEEQQMWVCAQIDHWYYQFKHMLVPPDCCHSLGYAKEQLKFRLCNLDNFVGRKENDRD
jgi:hypothetical protein